MKWFIFLKCYCLLGKWLLLLEVFVLRMALSICLQSFGEFVPFPWLLTFHLLSCNYFLVDHLPFNIVYDVYLGFIHESAFACMLQRTSCFYVISALPLCAHPPISCLLCAMPMSLCVVVLPLPPLCSSYCTETHYMIRLASNSRDGCGCWE